MDAKGQSLYLLADYSNAIKFYDKAIEISALPGYLNDKCGALYHLGKYKDAIDYFEKTIDIDPSSKAALIRKGNSLYNIK